MSDRTEVLLWAQRVIARKDAAPYMILEIAANADIDVAQEAFHKIARLAHPDLHRLSLSPAELERVTTAYARAAAAYHELRTRWIRGSGSEAREAAPSTTPPAPASPAGKPSPAMTGKALLYYRKAELSLRRGDLTGAVLQLKLAIASDPKSQLLRSALAEVEAELGKRP